MAQTKVKSSRRNFLLAVGAGSAATVAAVVVNTPARTAQPAGGATNKRATKGYTASAHTDSYYRTAKV